MPATVITTDDLRAFKTEIIREIKVILEKNSTPGPQKKWLRSGEVTKLLQISPGTLQALRISGKLSFTKIGRLTYYSYPEIERLIDGNQINYHKS